MKILIEEYQYDVTDVVNVLDGLFSLQDVQQKVSVKYVGYYYNPHEKVRDIVFILPKVLLGENDQVFGKYNPKDLIHFDDAHVQEEHRKFLYDFSVWIHRAIVVFNGTHPNNEIVLHRQIESIGYSTNKKKSNTLLDVILSLIRFNKENQQFITFILKNLHSGYNKINWGKTIARTSALVDNDSPTYLSPVNKKRQINFDEELIVIFFSILQYISETYGYRANINFGFKLIKGAKFEHYIKGFGKTRLRQIKYKYFSDTALRLWDLCYAFFDKAYMISINISQSEYLLVKSFHVVFEAMIDELIGVPHNELPNGLVDQKDGKQVDHFYTYNGLLINDKVNDDIYYIGDSKYYKIGNSLDEKSIYKQRTYVRNVINWNINLWLNEEVDLNDKYQKIQLFDPITEGYKVVPNFFISAVIDSETLSYNDKTDLHPDQYPQGRHFKNRLYDRDTLLLSHYNVNFLFILSLYARNNASQKLNWKSHIREKFRKETQGILSEKYDFYAMTPRDGIIADSYIEQHFRQLIGKIYAPYENLGDKKYFSLALDNDKEYEIENASLLAQLEKSFYIKPCALGEDPRNLWQNEDFVETPISVSPKFFTMHYLEKYLDKSILIGGYKGEKHLEWILGKNDKGTLIYNIRLGKNVEGGQVKARLNKMVVSFVVLYEFGHESENKYRVFHVHHHASMDKKRLIKSQYPSEPNSEKYFCYVFDEEVTLGNLNIHELLSKKRIDEKINDNGAPIFVSGKELLEYRR